MLKITVFERVIFGFFSVVVVLWGFFNRLSDFCPVHCVI